LVAVGKVMSRGGREILGNSNLKRFKSFIIHKKSVLSRHGRSERWYGSHAGNRKKGGIRWNAALCVKMYLAI